MNNVWIPNKVYNSNAFNKMCESVRAAISDTHTAATILTLSHEANLGRTWINELPDVADVACRGFHRVENIKEALNHYVLNDLTEPMYVVSTKYQRGIVHSTAVFITLDHIPSMCGGACLSISTVPEYGSRSILSSGEAPTHVTALSFVSGTLYGASSAPGYGSTIAGLKGQIVMVFNNIHTLTISAALRDMKKLIEKTQGVTPDTVAALYPSALRPTVTKCTSIGMKSFVLTTDYAKELPGYDEPPYNPRQLLTGRALGEATHPAKPWGGKKGMITMSQRKTGHVGCVTTAYTGVRLSVRPHLKYKIRTTIRESMATKWLVEMADIMKKRNNPCLFTDNTKRYQGQLRTKSLIAFLSDQKEFRTVYGRAYNSLCATLGGATGHKQLGNLKFIPWPKARNPNEGGHEIVGGSLCFAREAGFGEVGVGEEVWEISYDER